MVYLCRYFNFNLLILSPDSFTHIQEGISNMDRKYLILLKLDNKYKLLCHKSMKNYFFKNDPENNQDTNFIKTIIQKYFNIIVNFKDAYDYKIADLKEIAKKFNICLTGKTKKDEIYNTINEFFNN